MNRNQHQGAVENAAKVRERVENIVNRNERQAKGLLKQAKGKIKEAYGDTKDVVKKNRCKA